VLTNENVFALDHQPARLAVVGAGAVGCELAQAFARLGSQVTMVDQADRVLPGEDAQVSAVVAAALSDDRIDLRLGRGVAGAGARDGSQRVRLADGAEIDADAILVAAGRRPVTRGFGLDRLGVETDATGHIVVDDSCETNVAGVWAVGDVTQVGGFTHVAAQMGFVAAQNACRGSRLRPRAKIDRRVVPRVTFTDPEVAQVGLTEHEAAALGGRVAELPLDRVDRAVTAGRRSGFVKLIAGPRPVLRNLGGGQLLGATVVGPSAGELIAEAALAMRTRMFTGRLAQTIHAYPSWSMAVQQAATQFFFATDGLEARSAR
jgi:pyruvate/2-oxoglutarate dehydrogenase complex dihydrolipoamide dehydrogenase (E3) component